MEMGCGWDLVVDCCGGSRERVMWEEKWMIRVNAEVKEVSGNGE